MPSRYTTAKYFYLVKVLRRHTFLLVGESMQRMTPRDTLGTLRLRHDAIGCSNRITRRIPNVFCAVVTARLLFEIV